MGMFEEKRHLEDVAYWMGDGRALTGLIWLRLGTN
jgi:hypothetical protein